ncbi:hypothetical protein RDABS01_038908 [Bienertia sinuspersici]
MSSDLCRWLVRHFNPFQSSVKLKNGHLDIGIDDFHIVFGLPKCGNSMQLAGSRETSLEYNELVGVWLEHLGKDRSNVTISDIVNKMKEQEGGGENFKRNFVIMSLADCAREWKEADGTSLSQDQCLHFVIYGPSLLYGSCDGSTISVIKCWKWANIFNRRDLELKKAGEFGTGEVKPRLILNVRGQHVRYQQEIPTETTEHAKKACIEKVAQTAKILAKSFSEFVDAMDEAKMEFLDREPIVKLCDLASSIVQVFEDSEFKECTQSGEARTHCSDGSPRLYENDEIFNDPSFFKVVEFMEKSFTKKPSSCTFDAPSFDLGIDFSQDDGIATAVRKRKKVGSGDERV